MLVARYLFQKLLVAKNHLLLVAEIAGCKKLLFTYCKISSFLVTEDTHCKKSLVTCCKICSLLVAEVAPCKKSLLARCTICLLIVAEIARSKKYLVFGCIRNNHFLLKQPPAGIIVCLKPTKLGVNFIFFKMICFLRPKKLEVFQVNILP